MTAPAERLKRALPGTDRLRNYDVPTATPTLDPSKPRAGPSSNVIDLAEDSDSEAEDDTENENAATSAPAQVVGPAPTARTPYLSPYEIERNANIARNMAMIAELGLNEPLFQPKKAVRAPRKPKEVVEASRRSSRLAGGGDNADAPPSDPTNKTLDNPGTPSGSLEADTVVASDISTENPAVANLRSSRLAGDGDNPDTDAPPSDPTNRTLDNPGTSSGSLEAGTVVASDISMENPAVANITAPIAEPVVPSAPMEQAEKAPGPTIDNATATATATPVDETSTSMDVDVLPTPALPDNMPAWLVAAVPYLWKHSDDPLWKLVVTRFIKFEESLGFLDGKARYLVRMKFL